MAKAKRTKKQSSRLSVWCQRQFEVCKTKLHYLSVAAICVLSLGAVVAYGLYRARSAVERNDHFMVRAAALSCANAPSWLNDRLLEEIRRNGHLPDKFSLATPHITRQIHRAFSLHPWVERVVRVHKVYPNRLELQIKFRRPVARVTWRGQEVLLDRHGVLLPAGVYPDELRARLLQVVGVPDSNERLEHGLTCPRKDMKAAAATAAAIGPFCSFFGLSLLDVSNFGGRQNPREAEISLWTALGTRVGWGRAANTQAAGELPAAEKLARLRHWTEKYGTLDGPDDLDIYHWNRIVQRPRSKSPPAIGHPS